MGYPSDANHLDLMDHSFFGSGGFKDGTYLVQYARESDEKYGKRKKISYYLNYVRPIINSHVKPIFRRKIVRTDAQKVPAWTAFVADATGGGKPLQEFMKGVALDAKRLGSALVVVTAPPEAPANAAQEVSLRPYLYSVDAHAVLEIVKDRRGRVVKARFEEARMVDGKPATWVREITSEGWSLEDEHGNLQEAMDWDVPREDAPVVWLDPGDWIPDEASPVPRSEFYDIARVNAALFNMCSESHEISRGLTFPILRYPSKSVEALVIGVNNAMGFDGEGKHAPDFIAPPDGPLEQLRKEREGLVREMYRMAVLSHQAGTADSAQSEAAKSGVAMRMDKEDFDTALGDYAGSLEAAENRIRSIFAWLHLGKLDGVIDASVTYPRDFTLRDVTQDLQPLADSVAAFPAMPPTMQGKILQRVARLLLADEPDLQVILDEIAQGVIDASQSGGGAPGDGAA